MKLLNLLLFLILKKCSLKRVFSDLLVCPTYCAPQQGTFQVMTLTTCIEFHETSDLMLTENFRLLTDERIKEDIFKNLQHKHFLELHLFIVGYRLHGA